MGMIESLSTKGRGKLNLPENVYIDVRDRNTIRLNIEVDNQYNRTNEAICDWLKGAGLAGILRDLAERVDRYNEPLKYELWSINAPLDNINIYGGLGFLHGRGYKARYNEVDSTIVIESPDNIEDVKKALSKYWDCPVNRLEANVTYVTHTYNPEADTGSGRKVEVNTTVDEKQVRIMIVPTVEGATAAQMTLDLTDVCDVTMETLQKRAGGSDTHALVVVPKDADDSVFGKALIQAAEGFLTAKELLSIGRALVRRNK